MWAPFSEPCLASVVQRTSCLYRTLCLGLCGSGMCLAWQAAGLRGLCDAYWSDVMPVLMQAVLSELTTFLGEPADADPAHSLGMVWGFVTSFDRAFVKVAQACFKDASLMEELEEVSNTKKARHRPSTAV